MKTSPCLFLLHASPKLFHLHLLQCPQHHRQRSISAVSDLCWGKRAPSCHPTSIWSGTTMQVPSPLPGELQWEDITHPPLPRRDEWCGTALHTHWVSSICKAEQPGAESAAPCFIRCSPHFLGFMLTAFKSICVFLYSDMCIQTELRRQEDMKHQPAESIFKTKSAACI